MSDPKRLDPMLRFCCAVTGTDPEILKKCSQMDHRCIVRHALAMISTFNMAAVLWSFVLSEMLPLWGAIMGGLLAGLIIYLLDLSISTSGRQIKGNLREPINASFSSFGRFLVRSWKWLFRFGLAMTLALVTGTYVTLNWFSETLEEQIHQKRTTLNQPVEEEFQTQREQLRAELIAPIQRELDAAMAERSNIEILAMERDAKLIPDRSDFLMKFKGLNELRADEQYGSSIFIIAILTMLTIVIFESIFILIIMNDHATVYNLRALDPSK